jgi:type I restriction enzyme, S subunit
LSSNSIDFWEELTVSSDGKGVITVSNYQLPAGYKQTEVGVIPEDWRVVCLDSISRLSSGTTPLRAQEDRYYRNGEYHWVKTTDLNNSQITITEEKVTKAALDETCLQIYPPGTVLVAMYGGFNQIGRTGLIRIPAAVNQALVAIQAKQNHLDPEYLLANLNYRVEYWKSVASSSRKDPNITSQDVRNFVFPLPELEEQRSIAQALSDVDALIAALDQLIAKQRHLKTATMQQLLTGKKRLPGFGEGKGYKESAIGVIPEDWNVRAMSSLAFIQRGASPRPIDSPIWYDSKSAIGWVRISDVTSSDGKSLKTTRDYLSAKGILHSRFLPVGSLIMSICATVGIPVITQIDTCIHDDFVGFSHLQNVDQEFLYYKLKELEPYFKSKGQTGSQSNLNSDLVRDCEVALPPLSEQRAIATVLSDMDTEIAALETRLAKTQALKQGMMQELLTGRTRLL